MSTTSSNTTPKRRDPAPTCTHRSLARRITNVADGDDWRTRSHRSARVCDRRACVLDAAAWVERADDGRAIVYDNDRNEVPL